MVEFSSVEQERDRGNSDAGPDLSEEVSVRFSWWLPVAGGMLMIGCGPDGDGYEPDDSLEEASEIGVGESQVRTFHSAGDVDYVWFAAKEHVAYVIYTELGSPDMDTILTLLDSNGNMLAENDDYETQDYYGLESRIYWTAETNQTVYVVVETWPDSDLGTYYLTLEINDLFDAFEPDDSMETASEITDGETQERSFHDVEDVDTIRFDAVANGLYEVWTTIPDGEATDTYLSIVDAGGRQLAFNDNESAYSPASRLYFFSLEPGTYYIVAGSRYPGRYTLGFEDHSDLIANVVDTITDIVEGIDVVTPDLFEPDNSLETASASKFGVPQDRTLHLGPEGVDVDYIRFEATAERGYRIQTTIPDGAATDTILEVMDAAGTLLTEIDGGGDGGGDLDTFVAPVDGFYYLRVTAYNRQTYGAYTLLLEELTEP